VPPLLGIAAGPCGPTDPFTLLLLVDAELHCRRAGLMRADVGRREGVVEVRQPQRLAEARAGRVELVHAARLRLPAVARGVDRRADDAAELRPSDGVSAVIEVVVHVVAAARALVERVPPRLPAVEDVVAAHRVGERLARAGGHDAAART